MPNTTTPYGIAYPIASDSVAPLHTAFQTLADSTNQAFTTYLKPVTDTQQSGQYKVASISAMNALTGMQDGSIAFVTDAKSTYQWNGTSWVLMYKPWATFTQSMYDNVTTLLTAGFTVNTALYKVVGNQVIAQVKLTVASTLPVFTSGLYASIPETSKAILDTSTPIGNGTFNKTGVGNFPLTVWHHDTDKIRLTYLGSSPVKNSNMKTTPNTNPAAFVAGDTIVFSYTYSRPTTGE